MNNARHVVWSWKKIVASVLAFVGSFVGFIVGSLLGRSGPLASKAMWIIAMLLLFVAMAWLGQVPRSPRRAGRVLLIVGAIWAAEAVAAFVVGPSGLSSIPHHFALGSAFAAAALLVLVGGVIAFLDGRT